MTNIHAKQGLQTVGGFGVRRPRAGRGPDGGDSKFQIDVVVVRIDYNPAPVPGPWVLAGAPSTLSIRPALTSTRPPRCNDFQLFERLKLSAGLGAYPPYCPHRFLCSGVPTSRIAHHVVGERFGASRNVAAALFLGAPPRPTP